MFINFATSVKITKNYTIHFDVNNYNHGVANEIIVVDVAFVVPTFFFFVVVAGLLFLLSINPFIYFLNIFQKVYFKFVHINPLAFNCTHKSLSVCACVLHNQH